MPLLATRAAAYARGFGFAGAKPSYAIEYVVVGGGGTPPSKVVGRTQAVGLARDHYVGGMGIQPGGAHP